MTLTETMSQADTAVEFAKQAERLAQYTIRQEDGETGSTQAVEAKFITGQDPVIVTADGGRLPAVPVDEALKLNKLRDAAHGTNPSEKPAPHFPTRQAKDGTIHGIVPSSHHNKEQKGKQDAPLSEATPLPKTNPLFPPVPVFGPPTWTRNIHALVFRATSAVLSFCFLLVIILGSFATGIAPTFWRTITRLKLQNPDASRKFYQEEIRLEEERRQLEREWASRKQIPSKNYESDSTDFEYGNSSFEEQQYVPTEGGPDRLVCNVDYYARRVGLACETYEVQTEDGFIIDLLHIYNPVSADPRSENARKARSPEAFTDIPTTLQADLRDAKYPVLLIHGLLQSAGAYCCTDEASLAFYLAKSGLDVWLGNNRCGFNPRHTLLSYSDPRMWAWNIRQMGVMDLPALTSRVLSITGFPKLALVAHSQGTTQTLVALAKEQRPDLGNYLSIACLLAPAAYAGPLIGKMYFKFMRIISPALFRVMFGLHSFIPFMMTMHSLLPAKFYGFMGYRVFSFLFNWTDERWDRGLRDRAFQFSPVYISAECMRWWLGRECFATQKCILATRQEGRLEEAEDAEESSSKVDGGTGISEKQKEEKLADRKKFAWYDERCPPLAMWVAGSDDLVDGKRLLRRFENGREPFVDVVHTKVIEEYEHLDVLWAMDSVKQVGSEVLECIWKTVPLELREKCRVPKGCEDIKYWKSE